MNKEILVTRSSMPPFEEYMEEIKGLWESHQLTNMGPKHAAFESALAAYLGTPHLSLFTNGHLALEAAIEALQLTGEVITTPFTFPSTTHAIVRKGLTPVFCDIDPVTFTLDVSKIERLITEKTSAILPVHVYGTICDVDAIAAIAEKYHLKVLYDAAHAFGVRMEEAGAADSLGAAGFGDASVFSFHATKVFNTIEGGAVACRDPLLKQRIDRLKNFGFAGAESVIIAGGNAKMSEFQAAMGLCNLRHIDEQLSLRRRVAARYRELLGNKPGIQLLCEQPGIVANHAYLPVVFHEKECGQTRDAVTARLKDANIRARKYFYPLITDFDCYKGRFDSVRTPVAAGIASRVVCLPLYADLELDEVERICRIVLDEH